MCSSAVHLADTRPHSPTTLAHESIIHSIYSEADHAPTCAYHIFPFPIWQLGSHNITLFLRWRSESTLHHPARRTPRQHALLLCQPRPSSYTLPAVHYYLSTTDDRTKLIAKHVKHVYKASNPQRKSSPYYDPIACHSTCHSLVRVRHHEPRQPYNHREIDTPRSLDIRLPEAWG